jgi:hypothetical protein
VSERREKGREELREEQREEQREEGREVVRVPAGVNGVVKEGSMRLEITILLAIVLASNASAQGRLSGVVRDTLGGPMAGVEVTVQGVTRTVTTGATGAFEVPGIKPGTVAVTMRRLGYAPQSSIVKIVDGENTLPDIVITAVPRELDTVVTREQQLWRERPLLREFEENRKMGLGQFVTRADLAKLQGGFVMQVFNQKRGLLILRDNRVANRMWLANKYIPVVGGSCAELEDLSAPGWLSIKGANCNYCFPDIYLDYSRLSTHNFVPNVARFSPDQLEGIEIYLGAAETPPRYASGLSSCGVVVFHTRAVESKPRVIAVKQAGPTRSRVFASSSVSTAARCVNCSKGPAADVSLGYTLRDRWVLVGRYASWTHDGPDAESMKLAQALVEWYPHPDPGRLKWFVNVGGGLMSVDLNASDVDFRDNFKASSLPSFVGGTGVDVALLSRLVLTPFFSYTRSFTGDARHTRCIDVAQDDGTRQTQCFAVAKDPGIFNLKQVGVRVGWR